MECCKLYYQEQRNHSLHLIKECLHHGKKYLPFTPNLELPIIKSKKLQQQEIQVGIE